MIVQTGGDALWLKDDWVFSEHPRNLTLGSTWDDREKFVYDERQTGVKLSPRSVVDAVTKHRLPVPVTAWTYNSVQEEARWAVQLDLPEIFIRVPGLWVSVLVNFEVTNNSAIFKREDDWQFTLDVGGVLEQVTSTALERIVDVGVARMCMRVVGRVIRQAASPIQIRVKGDLVLEEIEASTVMSALATFIVAYNGVTLMRNRLVAAESEVGDPEDRACE